MKQLIIGMLLFCSLSGFGQKVYISQVFYDSPLDETKYTSPYAKEHHNGEFIELYNPSNYSVDMSYWMLSGQEPKEVFYFPSGSVISPKSFIVVTFRISNGKFCLSNLFPDIENSEATGLIFYQDKIIMNNKGEEIVLRDNNNTIIDRMTYTGTSPGALFARNGFGRTNINCVSLHRRSVSRDANGNGTFVTYDWKCGLVTPFGKPVSTIVDPKDFEIPAFSNQNYILTRTYTAKSVSSYLDVVRYFDGLGRPAETVQKRITPNGNDLVAYQEYDALGRESKSWLPVVVASNNGKFLNFNDFSMKSTNTYNNTVYNNVADNEPYAYPVYEPSPLNRIVEQYGPGQDWHKNGKSVKTDYLTNTSSFVVPRFTTTDDKTTVNITRSGNYDNNQLYITKTTDEDGNLSYEAKDKLGQVVYSRQMNGNDPIETCYIYDNFDNLRAVLPPLAVFASGIQTESSQQFKDYAYAYKYDSRNRCVWKKLPGCEPIYYVYDNADHLIFTQDGENRQKGEWQFSIPDVFGRVVLTGTCDNLLDYTADKPLGDAVVKAIYQTYPTNLLNSYTVTGVNLSSMQILLVNYYDDYSFMGMRDAPDEDNMQYNQEQGYDTLYPGHYKGLLVGTVTAQMNPDGTVSPDYLYSVMYYDYQKRVIQTKSNSSLAGGLEKEYIAYNFTGQPVRKKHIHQATDRDTQTEIYAYTYDDAGRLTKETHRLNEGAVTTLAENAYDELGRLKTNKKGGQANTNTAYAYNIRSWVKSIASPLFAENLYYNESYGGSDKRYNGNLSAMSWKVSDETDTRGYAFFYNNLSWLTDANYLENGSANGHYSAFYSYDKQGNIATLSRYGRINATVLGKIDSLTISYTGNQLKKITDKTLNGSFNGSMDFKDYINADVEYEYNANGAMTKDLNKGISDIQYNLLNLPRLMDIKSPVAEARNEYTYSAAGQKLKVVQNWNPNYSTAPVIGSAVNISSLSMNKTTDYVGNMIYEDGILKRILIDGGYIENGLYYYYQTDHLGNNRVVADASGALVQKNHYYPFGIVFAETSVAEQGMQPYKFGGKELDQMNGLNLYDNLARFYDPSFPHTLTPDQHCEDYYPVSPYSWCVNNPVNRIDPNGKDDFLVNPNGEIKQVEKEGEHVVVLVDRKGKPAGKTYNIGEGETVKLVSEGNTQGLFINDREKAHAAFKGIADHTKVEFAKIEYNETATNTDKTLLVTNGGYYEVSASNFAEIIEKNGIGTVTTIDHSHPNGYSEPSGYDRLSGKNIDPRNPTGDAKSATEYPTNAKGDPINRHVYVPHSNKAYKYDANRFYPAQAY